MPLTIRRKNGKGNWLIRGTVRVGKKSVYVEEYSVGSSNRALAETERARMQTETEQRLAHGEIAVPVRKSLAEAVNAFAARGTHPSDIDRMRIILEHFGNIDLSEITAGKFETFCTEALPNRSRNTFHRYRTTLRGMFKAVGLPPPPIAPMAKKVDIVAYLSQENADLLIKSYSNHNVAIATIARYTGLRAQEIARLVCSDIDLSTRSILVRKPKNKHNRIVPMHPRVFDAISFMIMGREPGDHVVRTEEGYPYEQRGNPWQTAHQTALRRSGIKSFRWHDWRHHWATWCVRPVEYGGGGMDLLTLMKVGGWSSLSQVEKYAAASVLQFAGQMLSRVG